MQEKKKDSLDSERPIKIKACPPRGWSHSTLWSWGQNSLGRLGIEESNQDLKTTNHIWNAHFIPTPVLVEKNLKFVQIAAGGTHSIALTEDGSLYTWGSGNAQQLGYGVEVQSTPKKVELETMSSISAGNQHTIAMNDSGTGIYQLGRKFVNPRLRAEKSLKIISVVAGSWHNMALTDTGNIYTWGQNEYGQLGTNSAGVGEIQLTKVVLPNDQGLTKFVHIGAGGKHSFAISESGQLYTWGAGTYGQLGHGDTAQQLAPKPIHLPGVKFIQASGGTWHSAALTDKGELYTWGAGGYGQLGHLAVDALETLIRVPTKVIFPSNLFIIKVAAGDNFTLALDREGNIWSFGCNNSGQLGYPTTKGPAGRLSLTPQRIHVPPYIKFVDIAAGASHALAIRNIPDDLANYLLNLFETSLYSDMTIEHQNHPYHLHKLIIDEKCPQLQLKLKKNPILGKMSPGIFREILKYLYTNRVWKFDNVEELKELEVCAEELGLKKLKKWCRAYMAEGVSTTLRNRIVLRWSPSNTCLKTLFEERTKYSDFELILQDGTTFPCHRAILGRCDFFSALFNSGMSESISGKLHLDSSPLSPFSLKSLLQYLYTDHSDHIHNLDQALQIYTNAGYYGFSESRHGILLENCEEIIRKNISVDTCLGILKMVPQASYTVGLRSELIDFVVNNYEQVAEGPELAQLDAPLFQEINVAFNLSVLKMVSILYKGED